MVVAAETPTRLLKDRAHLNRGLFAKLSDMSNEKKTGALERSEFVVSQQTAKWFRLLQHLNEVWDEANECITEDYGDYEENSPTAKEVVQCFIELSEGVQKLACKSIDYVMGQNSSPKNWL